MASTNKTLIGIGDQVIELKGEELKAFEADRAEMLAASLLLETEYEAKRVARANAINKLAEIAGLTEEEINAIL